MLADALRQNRPLVVLTGDLPFRSAAARRLHDAGLPEWAIMLPLFPGRRLDGVLALLTSCAPSNADVIALSPRASQLAGRLGRLLASEQSLDTGLPLATASGRADRSAAPVEAAANTQDDALQLLLSVLRDGLVITAADGAVQASNDAGRALLEILQPGDARQISHPALTTALAGVIADHGPEETELAMDGEPRRFLRISAAAAPSGNKVLLTLRDVTEDRLVHERLLQSEKMASIGQLVSGVAHELNNPLTGIMGFAQLLMMRDLSETVKREVTTIFEEAERASRIVQNLLSFARRRRPEKERVDLNVLIERVMDLRTYELRVHNVEPHTHLEPTLRMVQADPHQIQQVLLNVVRNAEQAILARGAAGVISCTTSEEGEWASVVISDDGVGIATENLRRIYDPFFTTKQVGEGTGLGLTISYAIVVEEHGGRISVDSLPGRGTTVKIQLPLATGDASAAPVSRPRTRTKQQPGRSILVIDDEPSIRDLLSVMLRDDGHEVEAVGDGTEGLQRLAVRDFDLIITDVKMPGVDGIEFYRRVKTWDAKVASRIIFTTGDMISPHTRDFLETVGNPHLVKPFHLADIKSLVAAMLPT